MSTSQSTKQVNTGHRGWLLRFCAYAGVIFVVLLVAGIFFIRAESRQAGGREQEEVRFTFEKGANIFSLASDLKKAGLIRSESAFLYYLLDEQSWKNLQAGEYLLSGAMPIPEIVGKLSRGETVEKGVKVTFPEGWTAADMAKRLTEKGLPGEEFLRLVNEPLPEWRTRFPFLAALPRDASLEGVLFPDTYFFSSIFGAETMIVRMLENFSEKASPLLTNGRSSTPMTPYQRLILASILETEVKTETDRRMVADVFLRRIETGMPLQSDATVRYVLGATKVKHSLEDIAIDSPYNTYKHTGLPPGPVSNPGGVSIRAAGEPLPNTYWYFLNNPETGETVFSETFEEHVANKAKHGL